MNQGKEKTFMGRGLRLNSQNNNNPNSEDNNKWTKAFGKEGRLKGLLDEVRKDKNLVVQIRGGYFNVYYKGGNLLKVNSENSFEFDSNYYKGQSGLDGKNEDSDSKRKEKRKELLEKLKNDGDWNAFIEEVKKLMDKYWTYLETRSKDSRNLDEKDTQHQLCLCNTESSEYTIIDLEFQVSTERGCPYRYEKPHRPDGRYVNNEKKSPRFDIIAVRNRDHKLCVIELKKGVDAIKGKSGVGDHADSFEGSIDRNPKAFVEEMKGVVEDKKKMHLLKDDFHVGDDEPEFLYAYSFSTEDKTCEREEFEKEQRKAKCEKYRVIYLDKGVYSLHD